MSENMGVYVRFSVYGFQIKNSNCKSAIRMKRKKVGANTNAKYI